MDIARTVMQVGMAALVLTHQQEQARITAMSQPQARELIEFRRKYEL